MTAARLYFRQLQAGKDFAVGDHFAYQMANLAYLIGDRATGEAVVVDPAYGVDELLDVLAGDQMRCVGALVTHHHADHVGGDLFGRQIEGITRLLDLAPVPIHVQRDEARWVSSSTGVGRSDLVEHEGGEVVAVGTIPIQLLHTPGHTPGSQCFLVGNLLVSGDTLFLDGCGRMDTPGGDPAAMYESLHTRLARIPDDTVVYPGHRYSPEPSASMGDTRLHNFVFQVQDPAEWVAAFGG